LFGINTDFNVEISDTYSIVKNKGLEGGSNMELENPLKILYVLDLGVSPHSKDFSRSLSRPRGGLEMTRERLFTSSSMFGYLKIVEQRIREAQEKGVFDDLPGQGEPLDLEDDRYIPEDLRMAYKILKNADCLPPELELKKEIRQMEDMLENIPDEKEKYRQIKKINYKIMQLNIMGHKSPLFEEKQLYYKKLVEKFGGK